MTDIEKLITLCKNDLDVARNKCDEANVQYRIQCAIIESLLTQLDRLETAFKNSKEAI